MQTDLDNWFNLLHRHSEALITWPLPGLLLLIALWWAMPAIKRNLADLRIRRCIRRLGHGSLHKVAIPDGLDGFAYIENLVLGDNSIYVLPVQRYHGVVFAAQNIDTWTQVVGKRSYKFSNPMRQLESDIQALRANIPSVDISGRVLFTKGAEFPKGKPDDLVSLHDIASILNIDKSTPVSSPLQQAWDKLVEISSSASMQELKSRLLATENSQTDKSAWLPVLLLVLAGGWLIWRLQLV